MGYFNANFRTPVIQEATFEELAELDYAFDDVEDPAELVVYDAMGTLRHHVTPHQDVAYEH